MNVLRGQNRLVLGGSLHWIFQGDSVFERSIEKSGFVETGFETFLAIKLLDKSLSELDVLLDFDNWRLVMGDSDAF